MACLRLFTRPPLPPLPERRVPLFLLRMALATVLLAPLLYLRRDADFLAAIVSSCPLELGSARKVCGETKSANAGDPPIAPGERTGHTQERYAYSEHRIHLAVLVSSDVLV